MPSARTAITNLIVIGCVRLSLLEDCLWLLRPGRGTLADACALAYCQSMQETRQGLSLTGEQYIARLRFR